MESSSIPPNSLDAHSIGVVLLCSNVDCIEAEARMRVAAYDEPATLDGFVKQCLLGNFCLTVFNSKITHLPREDEYSVCGCQRMALRESRWEFARPWETCLECVHPTLDISYQSCI